MARTDGTICKTEQEREERRRQEQMELRKAEQEKEESRWRAEQEKEECQWHEQMKHATTAGTGAREASAEEGEKQFELLRQEEKKKERELDRHMKEVAQLPWMKEDENVQQYLHSFEERMRILEIPQERWLSNI